MSKKIFKATITETYTKEIFVNADDKENAIKIAEEKRLDIWRSTVSSVTIDVKEYAVVEEKE